MGYRARQKLIQQLESARKSRVLTYVTSTRAGMETQMFMDAVRKVYEHLRLMDKGDKNLEIPVDLVIHSNGGDGTVPWRLVTLIREYTKNFRVIVPHRAFSAATLTALGANEILMHPMGMLGPTDATINSPFNPPDRVNPAVSLGIDVEDVTAFIALIKEDVGIHHEDEIVQAFNMLPQHVHPLALGKVKRTLSQSRMMARKLLSLHMDVSSDEHKIKEIVDNLTSKLFFHGHPIDRGEAREQIGLPNVVYPNSRLETLIWNLYEDYEEEMLLDIPYAPVAEFYEAFPAPTPGTPQITPAKEMPVVFVESAVRSDYSEFKYAISGIQQPNGVLNVMPLNLGVCWKQTDLSAQAKKHGKKSLRTPNRRAPQKASGSVSRSPKSEPSGSTGGTNGNA